MSNVDNILGATGFYGPNPYSKYQNGVPMPGYAGTPTDAMGRPIQPPPGVTLNTPPPAAAPAASGPDMSRGIYSMNGGQSLGLPMGQGVPLSSLAGGDYGSQNRNDAAGLASLMGMDPSKLNGFQQSKDPNLNSGVQTAPDMSNAISLLSNPGHVTTPGANVPATVQQPDALTSFLSSQGGNSGNFTNQGFFDTLNALRAGSGGAPSSSLAPNPGGQIANAFAPAKVGGLGGLGGV